MQACGPGPEAPFPWPPIEHGATHQAAKLLGHIAPGAALPPEMREWLARGKSNRDIGQILNVSYRTVNKHLEQMYPKLGVETRTSAVAIAIRGLETA